jgi:hypothetical protein
MRNLVVASLFGLAGLAAIPASAMPFAPPGADGPVSLARSTSTVGIATPFSARNMRTRRGLGATSEL